MDTEIKDKIEEACERYKKIQKSNIQKFKKLDEWLDKESNIFESECKPNTNTFPQYKRGDIVKVDFGVNIGTELSHTHFAIILNNDDTILTDNITVVPLTSKKGFKFKRVKLGNLISKYSSTNKYNNTTYAIITQIKTISKKRILLNNKKMTCNDIILTKIDNALANYLIKS